MLQFLLVHNFIMIFLKKIFVTILLLLFGLGGLGFGAISTFATIGLPAGFTQDSGYDTNASNTGLDQRGGDFQNPGIGEINAVLYNVKDYIKYIAGSLAILWLMVSAFRLVVAASDEAIQSAKKGIQWGIVGLILVFTVDIAVIAFFEGGAAATPGKSLIDINNLGVNGGLNSTLLNDIATYFTYDVRQIFDFIKVYGGAVAVLLIFAAGFQMITAGGNEESIEKQKKYLIHAVTAFVTLVMVDFFIFNVIYPIGDLGIDGVVTNFNSDCVEYYTGDLAQAPAGCRSASELASAGNDYIFGVVNFFSSLIGAIAVFFIIYSGVRIIASFGDQEVIDKHKKTLLWSLAGLVIVLLSRNVSSFFLTDLTTGDVVANPIQGIVDLAGITNFLATFVSIFSLLAILIAGVIWVSNFGNQEVADKAKKIIFGAVIGVILSLAAYAIVNSILAGDPTGGAAGTSVGVQISF